VYQLCRLVSVRHLLVKRISNSRHNQCCLFVRFAFKTIRIISRLALLLSI